MKKTQRKDAIRNIRKRIVSYLSVCLVVMLGLGGVFTTRYMEAGLEKQITDYYNDHKFKDYDLASSYGVSEANIKKIQDSDKVTVAEGVIQTGGSASFHGEKRNVTITSLTEKVSVPDVVEGKLPSGKSECMVGEDFAEVEGLKVGDRIHLSVSGLTNLSSPGAGDMQMNIDADDPDSGDDGDDTADDAADAADDNKTEELLYEKEFTITALMHHPDYLRRKAINTVSLPLSAFNSEATEGLYTSAVVRIEPPEDTGMFNEAYFEKTAGTRAAMEELAAELEEDRTQEVIDKANEYIDEEWEKAEEQLSDAEDEIEENEANLEEELANGRKKLEDAQKQLDKETKKYEKLFRDGEKTIKEKDAELADAKIQLGEKKKELAKAKAELAKAKKKISKKEKELKAGKKELAKRKSQLKTIKKLIGVNNIEGIYKTAKRIRNQIDDIDKLIDEKEDEEIIEKKIKSLGRYMLDNKDSIKTMFEMAAAPAMEDVVEMLKTHTGVDLKDDVEDINSYGYERFMEDAEALRESGDLKAYKNLKAHAIKITDSIIEIYGQLKKAEKEISKAEKKIASGEQQLAGAKEQIKEYERELKAGEEAIAAFEKQLKEGERLLKQKKKELKDGKAEFSAEKAKGEKKIKSGWADYYDQKTKYEGKIEEATALLAENREKAEEKLAEARAEAENIEPCKWIVVDRKGNAGYIDAKTNLDSISSMGILFGLLFSIITAIVCFSTLVIIIDEQKTLVGTSKAFGFYKREVLGKYLVFGVSAAVVGSILAVIGSFVLSDFVQVKYAESGMYPTGVAKSIITPLPTVLFALLIAAVNVAATIIACGDILRSPASLLMKGAVLKKEKKKKKTVSRGGSLYSRLIIRNMIQDKARVTVTVAIIAFSCMLIGLGISMKFAFDGMIDRQISDVNRFDIRMDMNDDVTDEDEAALVRVLEKNSVDYMPATAETTLYRWNDRLDGVSIICADPERIGEFYGVIDPNTGEDISIPEDGVLIQKRMHESYGMNEGDGLTLLDKSLREHEAKIAGTFINYAGRTLVLSPDVYRSVFGEANDVNCYYIKGDDADIEKAEEELLAVSNNISFVAKDEFRAKYEAGSRLYNVVVYITTGIAILISFMILTNLANIYLTRKKRELTVMRVNGFTVKETKGYLSRESILTTVLGLALGVALGALLTPIAIKTVQQPDQEFIKSFNIMAWVVAVGLEALFSLIINTAVYRKVKDLNLRDIA